MRNDSLTLDRHRRHVAEALTTEAGKAAAPVARDGGGNVSDSG